LSDKHINRINDQPTAAKKLALYRKYFKKDSTKAVKKAERYWQSHTDSLVNAIARREKAIRRKGQRLKDGVSSRIYRTVYGPWAKKRAKVQLAWLDQQGIGISNTARKALLIYFEDHFLQATQNDSLLTVLKTALPSLQMPRQLLAKIDDYQLINPGKAQMIRQLVREKHDGAKVIRFERVAEEKAQEYRSQVSRYSR